MDRGNSVSEAYLPTLFNNDEIQRGPRVKLGGGSIGSMLAKRYTAAIYTRQCPGGSYRVIKGELLRHWFPVRVHNTKQVV